MTRVQHCSYISNTLSFRYCGRGFQRTIVSHGETLSLTIDSLNKGSQINAHFRANVRLIRGI